MINLPARIYSKAVWETIRYRTRAFSNARFKDVDTNVFPATTSSYTQLMLFLCTVYFQPKNVIEIGTYIGRSTNAITLALPKGGVINTCDIGDDLFTGNAVPDDSVILHPKTSSTDMLKALEIQADLFFFDGRLPAADVPHIERLSHDKTVYLFDDAEGIEKGICNMLLLQHLGIIVYPEEGQTLGMIIRKIGLTRQ